MPNMGQYNMLICETDLSVKNIADCLKYAPGRMEHRISHLGTGALAPYNQQNRGLINCLNQTIFITLFKISKKNFILFRNIKKYDVKKIQENLNCM